jgi:SAM-dependent methyltransferase
MTTETLLAPTGDTQATLWNGRAGCAWIDAQSVLDAMLQPFETLLVDAVAAASATRVLDVGCGTGSTTLAIARRLAADGCSVGIDISAPMVEAARIRAAREDSAARFIRADAQAYAFEPAGFDLVVSRFGVMFFDDPPLAFANLRRAARDDARLWFVAWRSAADNPFMTAAERAAAPLLPTLPPRRPDVPGQFAFADPQRVQEILEQGGWSEVDIRPIDVECTLPERDLLQYMSRLGPVGLLLQEANACTRERVLARVRAAFDPYVHGDEVRFTAACWMVGARAAGGGRG